MTGLRLLFYLLIALIPVQLNRYFWLDGSYRYGIPIDYLAWSVYATDILSGIILLGIGVGIVQKKIRVRLTVGIGISLILLGLLSIRSIAANEPVIAGFAAGKLAVCFGLIYAGIALRLDPRRIVVVLSVSSMVVVLLAVFQWSFGRSIGGVWYWAGERAISISAPQAATASLFSVYFLRPYATFPHPNVLAGYLVFSLTSLIAYGSAFPGSIAGRRLLRNVVMAVILGGLIITYSRWAWIVAGLMVVGGACRGVFQKAIERLPGGLLTAGYVLIILSWIWAYLPDFPARSFWERQYLIREGWETWQMNPIIGVGLLQSLGGSGQKPFLHGIYSVQPVHSIYLLWLIETGFVGFGLAGILWGRLFSRIRPNRLVWVFPLLSLFLLGLFDHFLITLHQGRLMMVAGIVLAFNAINSYTKESSKFKDKRFLRRA